ncbi:hypothetical protein HDU92_007694 [Lobulomyces angularis]|nr:hypothetical protein HDU92_007694 [Lobulomyces angularis]
MNLALSQKKKLLGDYHIGKTVGQGAFSKVKIGFHKQTNQKVAIKVIDKRLLAENARREREENMAKEKKKKRPQDHVTKKNSTQSSPKTEKNDTAFVPPFIASLQLEVQLLMRLNHPNVIKLYQVMETEDECLVVMEYASGGELLDLLTSKGKLTEKEARKYFRQLISAVDHCHLANIVHRDIKLENLLLDNENNLLLSDFGLGRTFENDTTDLMRTFCGTPNYAAAELVSGIPYVGIKSDIWAMGIVLFILASGNPPFFAVNLTSLYSKIKAVDYKCPDYFSPDLKLLIAKILVKDPLKRIDIEGLRNDSWVKFDESEEIKRIYPKLIGSTNVSEISQFIAGITNDMTAVTYTINNHHSNAKCNLEETKSNPLINVNKFGRIIKKEEVKNTTKNILDHPQDSLAPLGQQSNTRKGSLILTQRKSLQPGDMQSEIIRNRATSASPTKQPSKHPRYRAVSVGTTIERPVDVSRRMSMFTIEKNVPDVKITQIENRKSLSKLGNNKVGDSNKLIKSPSAIIDDKDPFLIENEKLFEPTTEEIFDWHKFHTLPKEVRTVRFSFNTATTSSFEPANIFRELHRALIKLKLEYSDLKVTRVSEYYLCNCFLKQVDGEESKKCDLAFEIEVCKVWMLKIHGLRFKRLFGEPFLYKSIYNKIVNELVLR